MASEAKLLTIEFLKWIAARPRSVAEARQAWSSTCPLNCAWEDAITEDLIEARRRRATGADRSRPCAPCRGGVNRRITLR
jgi:hypothetical protein